MQLVFNELSLQPPASDVLRAEQWMHSLAELIAYALRYRSDEAATLEPAQRLELGLAVSSAFYTLRLGPSLTVVEWLFDREHRGDEARLFLQRMVDKGPIIEEIPRLENSPVTVTSNGQPGQGIKLAWLDKRPVISAASWPPWQDVRLPIELTGNSAVQKVRAELLNIADTGAWEKNLAEVALSYCLKPKYEDPGHHDRSSPSFRGGGAMTTLLPRDAEQIYAQAVPGGFSGRTWWGLNADGDFYRYQTHRPFCVHWNGTTAPGDRSIRIDDVPISVRRWFEQCD